MRKGAVLIGGRNRSSTLPAENIDIAPPPRDPRATFPFIIHHDGRLGGTTRLFAENESVQLTWKSKLEEATLLWRKSSQVFETSIVAREEFLVMVTGNSNAYSHETRPSTRMTCATPFGKAYHLDTRSVFLTTPWATPVTQDGRTLLAIGFSEGLWIGSGKDLRCGSLQLLTQIEGMTKISSFLLGAPSPDSTMCSGRRIRSHYPPFSRSTSDTNRLPLPFRSTFVVGTTRL